MKHILIPILSFTICLSVIWRWTYGFSAFTIFSYTLKDAGKLPRDFPDFEMIDQNGKIFKIKDKHKFVMLNFIYLNCPLVCHKVTNQLEDIYHSIDKDIVPKQLEFITVSFDLKNDDVDKIKKYRSYFGTDIDGWTFALPYESDQKRFNQFLQKAGVWAYEVPETGLINHSVYIFLLSPGNKILKIFDPVRDNDESIISQTYQCIIQ